MDVGGWDVEDSEVGVSVSLVLESGAGLEKEGHRMLDIVIDGLSSANLIHIMKLE